MALAERSLKKLEGVHEDLVAVVMRASEKTDFLVTEGLRSKERQRELLKAGRSQTMNSRHLYGLAVDLCDCDGCYDVPDMQAIARSMKSAAAELDIPIKWGGDWKTFKDTPHFELDRAKYPDSGKAKPWTLKPTTKTGAVGAVAGVGSGLALPFIPSIPAPPVEAVSSVAGWQNAAETLNNFAHSPAIWIAIAGILIALAMPVLQKRFG